MKHSRPMIGNERGLIDALDQVNIGIPHDAPVLTLSSTLR